MCTVVTSHCNVFSPFWLTKYLSNYDCLGDKREDFPNISVLHYYSGVLQNNIYSHVISADG